MIYFTKPLQARVHQLFYDSLVPFGILGIGSHETMRLTDYEHRYEAVAAGERLYKRLR
jgi:chemotaxis protein methyltransferase CheR